LPTGSFKARGMALAIAMAKTFGVRRVAAPTAGNAGAAAAAYAAAAGMEAFVFTPEDTPEATVREIAFHGARLYRVNGLINQCARIVREGTPTMGWHDLSTLEEPYRIEGKKTMGLELAEQLGWQLPDLIYYPTGGGTGFIGMWKAFAELEAMGWIGAARPRMVAVQSPGCGPIVRAFAAGLDHVAEPWAPVETGIHGVRVPRPLGDRLIMRVIYESNGFASDASDEAAEQARAEIARDDGVHLCPEGALCYAAWKDDLASGRVDRDEQVVIFNTANGLKSPMPATTGPVLDCTKPVDYGRL
jgi:threonine synthase